MVQARQEPAWAPSTLLVPSWLSWLGICPSSLVGISPPWEREQASPCLVPVAGWGTGGGQGVWPDHSVPHLRNSFHPSRFEPLCSWVGWLEANRAIDPLLRFTMWGPGSSLCPQVVRDSFLSGKLLKLQRLAREPRAASLPLRG